MGRIARRGGDTIIRMDFLKMRGKGMGHLLQRAGYVPLLTGCRSSDFCIKKEKIQ